MGNQIDAYIYHIDVFSSLLCQHSFVFISRACSISPSGREDTAAALRKMSQQMRTVVCHLKQIPNQPIVFKVFIL